MRSFGATGRIAVSTLEAETKIPQGGAVNSPLLVLEVLLTISKRQEDTLLLPIQYLVAVVVLLFGFLLEVVFNSSLAEIFVLIGAVLRVAVLVASSSSILIALRGGVAVVLI